MPYSEREADAVGRAAVFIYDDIAGGKMTATDVLRVSDQVRASFAPIIKALGPVRRAVADLEAVAEVRPGYDLSTAGDPAPAVVIAVMPGTPRGTVDTAELVQRLGVPCIVIDATPDEQIAAQDAPARDRDGQRPSTFERLLNDEEPPEFVLPRTGSYEPLDPSRLPLLDEPMDVTICVSPEAGWGELERFLAGTTKRLTVAMYQFTAPHIFRAVRDAVVPAGRTMSLVLHPAPEPPPKFGVKAQDMAEPEIVARLAGAMGDRFQLSWATLVSKAQPDGLWASSYHIKVAVRDGEAFWLSSGNWQSSNQPKVHPFGGDAEVLPPDFHRQYNRDYHAVIKSGALAAAFETYIRRDAELISASSAARPIAQPDLFVPEAKLEAPIEFAAPAQLFPPLRLTRRLRVQPLLTPDNYVEHTLALIRSAKSSVWYQNQYISFRGPGEDFNEFQLLVQALKSKIDEGLDVRLIFRDFMKQANVDILLALGFPRNVLRFQSCCHTKTIIVDRRTAMFGSHNWSNEGVKSNRDASLIFYDEEIADYLARVYEYDWEQLATPDLVPAGQRVAFADEPAPAGFVRVPYAAVFED
jgi:hypothetical protein